MHDAEHEKRKRRGKSESGRAAAEPGDDQQADIHAQHDEFAVGEIDEIHHSPDQRETRGEQRVDGPQQQTTDDDLQKQHT